MTKPLSLVTTLFETNARQIPEMMRKLASEVERPPVPDVNIDQAVCIVRDSSTGQLNIYGWGEITTEQSIAMIAIATQQLSSLAFGGNLWPINQGGSAPKDAR